MAPEYDLLERQENSKTRACLFDVAMAMTFIGCLLVLVGIMAIFLAQGRILRVAEETSSRSNSASSAMAYVLGTVLHYDDAYCQTLCTTPNFTGAFSESHPSDAESVTRFYANVDSAGLVGTPPVGKVASKYDLYVADGGNWAEPLDYCAAFKNNGKSFYVKFTQCDYETGDTWHQQFSDPECLSPVSANKFNAQGACYRSTAGPKSFRIFCQRVSPPPLTPQRAVVLHYIDDHCQTLWTSPRFTGVYNQTAPSDSRIITGFFADPVDPAVVGPPPAPVQNKFDLYVANGGSSFQGVPLNLCAGFLLDGKPLYSKFTECDPITGVVRHQDFSDSSCTKPQTESLLHRNGECNPSTLGGSFRVLCRR
mmetsp:Transcript_31622/g.87264  ORF Transcript_31622/g.87264 Transcript_31622/m.87264 type:complete len:366 (+) Transcript_31622:76-1173(+)